MPITFATSVLLLAFAPTRHRHQRGTDDAIVESICLLMLLNNGPLRLIRRDMCDRFVFVWIEWLADRVDALESLGFEDRSELPLDEPHPLDPRGPLELVGDRGQRAVVPVEDVEELRDQIGFPELRELGTLGLRPLAVVSEVRGHPLAIVRKLGLFLA